MDIGRVGVWTGVLDPLPASQAQEVAAELEDLGYGALWLPEAVGREAMTNASLMLSGTHRMVVATGVASIWARDAVAQAQAHRTLTEAYPYRFLLGLGVSHDVFVDSFRGQNYERPLARMSSYLDAMDAAVYMGAAPTTEPQRVLAALGPRMLELSAEKAAGAHTYFVTVEHTAQARDVLGSGPMLVPEQAVVLETDPERARDAARAHMSVYLGLPNYTQNLRRLGFSESDVSEASDRLVDALVAWGTVDDIVDRVRAHHDAGADHVCIQVLGESMTEVPVAQWRLLADALL